MAQIVVSFYCTPITALQQIIQFLEPESLEPEVSPSNRDGDFFFTTLET